MFRVRCTMCFFDRARRLFWPLDRLQIGSFYNGIKLLPINGTFNKNIRLDNTAEG